jgi:FixJ family two-component response regulator
VAFRLEPCRRTAGRAERIVSARALVAVVDDDRSVREALPRLLRKMGFSVKSFASAEAFLKSPSVSRIRCLILDICLPGMSGPDLQRELTLRGVRIPIVFISAQTDEHLHASLRAEGASACLTKPFDDGALLQAVSAALQDP